MSVTTPSPSTAAEPVRSLGEQLLADAAEVWPDFVPSEDAAPPPAARGRDAAAPTHDNEAEPGEEARTAPYEPKKAALKKAPVSPDPPAETVTMTAAELALLRRQAADQSVTAKRLAEAERKLALTEQARVASLGEIAKKYDGTEVKAAAYEELLRGRNYIDAALSEESQQSSAVSAAAMRLHAEKISAASLLMHEMMVPLDRESAALGIERAELLDIIEEVKASDDKVRRFGTKFQTARTLDDARDAAEVGYELLGERVMARLQERKIASLQEPEPEVSAPKKQRTHAFGGGVGNVEADPYQALPIEQRASARIRDQLLKDAASLWPQE